VTGEVEAVVALDRANFLRMVGGNALAIVGLFLLLRLLLIGKKRQVRRSAWLFAWLLVVGGVVLASWQVYS